MEKVDNFLSKNEDLEITFLPPKPIGCFSLDIKRKFVNDISGLKYFVYPLETKLDLNIGFNTFIKKPDTVQHERINNLLKFIVHNFPLVRSAGNNILNSEFLCFRGLLSLILKTPYERDNWTICAVKWKGTIYLCEFNKIQLEFDKCDVYNYWGHKFENYTLSSSPNMKTENHKPVNECEEFCVVFQSQLNGVKLLYGAEIDGVISDECYIDKTFLNDANFVELKTNRIIENSKQDMIFRKHKLLKFWSQSFLVGIKRIMVGYRTDKGIVNKILPITVSDIPKKCHEMWDSHQCLQFLYGFLSFVKNIVNKADDNIVWKFQYDGKSKVINYEKTEEEEYNILPNWYKEEVQKLWKGF